MNYLRVITGKAKGHKLNTPKGLKTRPTADRVKESIFNILGHINDDSLVLDLFSGSGNIGIEFLSRGAKESYFIDKDTVSIKCIKQNLNNTKLLNQASVYKQNVNKAMNILGNRDIKFNYIFMDPPYNKNLVIPTLQKIHENQLLFDTGIIIIEHESTSSFPDCFFTYSKIDMRKYGDTAITFYKKTNNRNY